MERTMKQTNDDLDSLLGAYFRSEMPHPWPVLNHPRKTTPARKADRHAGDGASSSKFALAASLTLLLAGGWLLSDKFGTPSSPLIPLIGKGIAGKNGTPPMPQKGQPAEELVPNMK